ncbi:hypothetical protein ACMFMF_008822 [Clarireedia jacksonii]
MSDYNLDHPGLSPEQLEHLRANPLEACQRENEALKVQLGTYDQLLQTANEALGVERGHVETLRAEADLAVKARDVLASSLDPANSLVDTLRQECAEAKERNAELEAIINSSAQPDQKPDELLRLKAALSATKIKSLDKDIQLENARKALEEMKSEAQALRTRQTPQPELADEVLTTAAEYGTMSSSMAQTPQWSTPESASVTRESASTTEGPVLQGDGDEEKGTSGSESFDELIPTQSGEEDTALSQKVLELEEELAESRAQLKAIFELTPIDFEAARAVNEGRVAQNQELLDIIAEERDHLRTQLHNMEAQMQIRVDRSDEGVFGSGVVLGEGRYETLKIERNKYLGWFQKLERKLGNEEGQLDNEDIWSIREERDELRKRKQELEEDIEGPLGWRQQLAASEDTEVDTITQGVRLKAKLAVCTKQRDEAVNALEKEMNKSYEESRGGLEDLFSKLCTMVELKISQYKSHDALRTRNSVLRADLDTATRKLSDVQQRYDVLKKKVTSQDTDPKGGGNTTSASPAELKAQVFRLKLMLDERTHERNTLRVLAIKSLAATLRSIEEAEQTIQELRTSLEEQRSNSRNLAGGEGIDSSTPQDQDNNDDNLELESKLKAATEVKDAAIRRAEEAEKRLEDCMDLVNGPLAQKEVIGNLKELAREARSDADRKEQDWIAATKERDIIRQIAMLDAVKYKARIAEQQDSIEKIHAQFAASETRKLELEDLLKMANAESATIHQIDALQGLLSINAQRISELEALLVVSSEHALEMEDRLREKEQESFTLQESAVTAASDHATETAQLEDLLQESRDKANELMQVLLATSTNSSKLEAENERLQDLVKATEDANTSPESRLSQFEDSFKAPHTNKYENQASQTIWAENGTPDDVDAASVSPPGTIEPPLIAAQNDKSANAKQKRKPKVKRRRASKYNPQADEASSSSDRIEADEEEPDPITEPTPANTETQIPIEGSPAPAERKATEERRGKQKSKARPRRSSKYDPKNDEAALSSEDNNDDEEKPSVLQQRVTTKKKIPSTMAVDTRHRGLANAGENEEDRGTSGLRSGARRTRNSNPVYVGEVVVQGSGMKRKSSEGGGGGGSRGGREKKVKGTRR